MCNEIMCRKKVIIVFCSKIIVGATKINLCKTSFSNLENFSAFLVKLLNTVSIDQKIYINVLYKRKFQSCTTSMQKCFLVSLFKLWHLYM